MVDAISPILQGLLQGANIGQMMQQTAMQQEAARRNEIRYKHEQDIAEEQRAQDNQDRDLRLRREFQLSGRPVDGNTVSESTDLDVPDVMGTRREKVEFRRPVDRSRLLSAKLSDGTPLSVEAYSPEEMRQRVIDERLAVAKAEGVQRAQQAAEMRRSMLGEFGVDLNRPGGGGSLRVLPDEVGGVSRGLQDLFEADQPAVDGIQGTHYETGDDGTLSVVTTTKSGKRTVENLGKLGKSKARAGGGGAPSADKAAEGLQEKHDKAFSQENDQWAQHQGFVDAITNLEDELANSQPDDVRKRQIRAQIVTNRAKAAGARAKAEEFGRQKGMYLGRKDKLRGGKVDPAITAPSKDGKVLDEATVRVYLQKAGGDPAKARQLAAADGWR